MKREKQFRPDKIGDYFRIEWLPLALVTVSGLIYNIGLLAAPWFEGRLAQCLADILGGNAAASAMAMLVLAYILVTLLVQAARFIKRFYVRRFANNINRRMKGVLYANLVRQSRAALEKEGAGELMTKAISDVDDCVEGMRKFTTEVFDTGVALVGYIVMLLVYDWRLALLSLVFTPVSYVCAAGMKKPVQREGAAYKKAAGALRTATLDRARNAATYRNYGCETAREERYEDVLKNYARLRFSPAVAAAVRQDAANPKRMQREIRRTSSGGGVGTKAQQALQLQREEQKLERAPRPRPPRDAVKQLLTAGSRNERKSTGDGNSTPPLRPAVFVLLLAEGAHCFQQKAAARMSGGFEIRY